MKPFPPSDSDSEEAGDSGEMVACIQTLSQTSASQAWAGWRVGPRSPCIWSSPESLGPWRALVQPPHHGLQARDNAIREPKRWVLQSRTSCKMPGPAEIFWPSVGKVTVSAFKGNQTPWSLVSFLLLGLEETAREGWGKTWGGASPSTGGDQPSF